MKIIVCLSGGLDSATALASLVDRHICTAIGFDYGQPPRELIYAQRIADKYKVDFEIVKIPKIPKINDVAYAARNLVFAANAIAIAQAEKQHAVALGPNAGDWDRFPDCRPPFWDHMRMIGEVYNVKVLTPLLLKSKVEIVRMARTLGLPIEMTWSCYSPAASEKPCGACLACKTRNRAILYEGMSNHIQKIARAVEKSAVYEDRMEYSVEDLQKCYGLNQADAGLLHNYLHREDEAADAMRLIAADVTGAGPG